MTKARPLTEEQWLDCQEPYVLLRHLQQHCTITRVPGGRRRLRLFSCACCRHIWHLFEDERCRNAVEVAERYAVGEVRKADLQAAWREAQAVTHEHPDLHHPLVLLNQGSWVDQLRKSLASAAEWSASTIGAVPAAHIVAGACLIAFRAHICLQAGSIPEAWDSWHAAPNPEPTQCDLLRDIFGNPFAPVVNIKPGWLRWNHGTVEKLARTLLAERAFDQMPVLGDALEEAGCTDPRVLEHCRQNAPHALGCWLLDALLGNP
jgi:hypothetical protein